MESLKFVMTSTFYPPYHLGGDAVHVHQLSNELAKLGHEVHVIHSIDSYHWQRKGNPKHNSSNHENVTVHSIKSPIGKLSPLISYTLGSPFPVTNKIRNIIDEVQPDVLHHHNIAGLGPFILNIKAPKVLYTAHDYWSVCPMNGLTRYDGAYCHSKSNCFMCSILSKRPPQFWRYKSNLNETFRNVDSIIAPSDFMKDRLINMGLNGNFITIHNFVPEPKRDFKNDHSYPYFLFVGVLEKHKGILELINSFIDIKDEIDINLVIAGSGSLKSELENIVIKNKCANQVNVLGRVDDDTLASLYANALALIIPSIWPENCPLVALEALSHGTPIIVSNKGGLPEFSQISKKVHIFEDFDSLKSLLKDNEQYYNDKDDVDNMQSIFLNKYFKILNE